jgi:16S rRNA (cytosine967-C5)-methyltransferase
MSTLTRREDTQLMSAPRSSARAVARDALMRIEDGAYAHVLLPQLLRGSSLSLRDRALVTDLVYGTVRSQRWLDDLLSRVGRRRIDKLDPPVRAALRIGAYQLVQGVAPHAAVGEVVSVVPPRARGYANAVLRALSQLGPPWAPAASEAVALSYPDWIVARLSEDLGTDDALAALAASNEAPTVALRVNASRTTTADLADELSASGADVTEGTLVPGALLVRGAGDMGALPAVAEGRATPQDQASQAVATFLAPKAGERVLDVAAAPGGKATAIAEQLGGTGLVVAADLQAGRLRFVQTAAARLGLTQVACIVADGRALPFALTSSESCFDRVLVDAPCSGLGVLRRRPDARWRIEESALAGLAELQVALTVAAAGVLRPGGLLVYSVCTLTARETREVAVRIQELLPGFTPTEPPAPPWRPWGSGALLLPQDAGTDGMFVLGLRRGER